MSGTAAQGGRAEEEEEVEVEAEAEEEKRRGKAREEGSEEMKQCPGTQSGGRRIRAEVRLRIAASARVPVGGTSPCSPSCVFVVKEQAREAAV